MSNRDWLRATREKPCVVCQRPNGEHTSQWCTSLRNGRGTCCMFIESPCLLGNGGWMHWTNSASKGKDRARRSSDSSRNVDWEWLVKTYRRAATRAVLTTLAAGLGVSVDALVAGETGWDGEAHTFPMRRPTGEVTGIRRRMPDGGEKRYLCVEGSKNGLFSPAVPNLDGVLWVAEGPTDRAALMSVGLPAIGRPQRCGCFSWLAELSFGRAAVIVSDADHDGMRDSLRLLAVLRKVATAATMILPPDEFTDAREWVRGGATKRDFLEAAGYGD